MKKKIIQRQYSEGVAGAFSEMHPVLRRVLAARQVQTADEITKELNHLIPYQSLLGIDDAAKLLADALAAKHRILIVGDFDADGATSTAVAVRALKAFGAQNVNYLVPNRFAFGYGLTPELVAVAKTMSPDMIVTVDNGIANHAGVAAAKAQGIRVLITDHHLAAATLPDADVIVNPNQPNDPFPSKNLAGVGVVFYVMLALRKELQQRDWFNTQRIPEPNMSSLLDIVALGTVADLVPLDHNNRVLVHQGLRRIRAGKCVSGIVALLELANRDFTRAVAADLGFAVAARLNAAGRLDDMSLGIECLLSDDPVHAREIARTLDQMNLERRNIEQDMQAQALSVLDRLQEKLKGELPRGLVLFDETWHQGVIGILASRLKEKFNRPVIIFALGQDGEIKGSARSVSNLHIRDVLASIDAAHPGLIKRFGGHAMAAGLTMNIEKLADFIGIFDDAVSKLLTEADLAHCILSDGSLTAADFNLDLAAVLRDAGPWGQAFPEPVFDGQFNVLEQRIVGDKHLKLRLGIADKIIDGIAFFVDTSQWPNHRCDQVRAAYRLDINEYKGRSNVQLIVEHIESV